MDKRTVRVRVRDARGDDTRVRVRDTRVKANKRKRKRKHMSTLYGDVPKPKSNLDLCANPIGVPVPGRVMLDPLRSRSLFAPFSTTRLSIKQCSSLGLDLLCLSFW